jgi:membrane carboxypeptidase/penicillin-binding protein
MARQLVFTQYGDDAYTRGLNVYTDLKRRTEQMVAYRALRKGIMDYERRQVYRGPEDYVDLPANPKESTRASPTRCRPPRQRRAAGRRRARANPEEGRRGAAERRVDHRSPATA